MTQTNYSIPFSGLNLWWTVCNSLKRSYKDHASHERFSFLSTHRGGRSLTFDILKQIRQLYSDFITISQQQISTCWLLYTIILSYLNYENFLRLIFQLIWLCTITYKNLHKNALCSPVVDIPAYNQEILPDCLLCKMYERITQ